MRAEYQVANLQLLIFKSWEMLQLYMQYQQAGKLSFFFSFQR